MKTKMIAIGIMGFVAATTTQSIAGESWRISWYSIDGGGTIASRGGSYSMSGTIGQTDTAVLRAVESLNYEVIGGFWAADVTRPSCSCTTATDCRATVCDADNACNRVSCDAGECTFSCTQFGDVTGQNGQINLDDILYVLSGFSSFANYPNADIAPCAGDGIVSLDDILSVLGAFAGASPCACTENATPGAGVEPHCGSSRP